MQQKDDLESVHTIMKDVESKIERNKSYLEAF